MPSATARLLHHDPALAVTLPGNDYTQANSGSWPNATPQRWRSAEILNLEFARLKKAEAEAKQRETFNDKTKIAQAEDAIRAFGKAIEEDEENALAWFNRGRAYFDAKEY